MRREKAAQRPLLLRQMREHHRPRRLRSLRLLLRPGIERHDPFPVRLRIARQCRR